MFKKEDEDNLVSTGQNVYENPELILIFDNPVQMAIAVARSPKELLNYFKIIEEANGR